MPLSSHKMIFDVPIDLLSVRETLERIDHAIESKERLQHGLVNVAKVIKMRRDPNIYRYVAESDMINIDGAGVVLGARLLGYEVPERVAGIDLMDSVLALCETKGYKPYFIGAKEEVIQAAVRNIAAKYPELKIAGWRNGYFSEAEEPAIVADIATSGADCLFIGMTTPKKERMLHQYRDQFDVPFQMGVGGSFDVIAGITKRAPEVWQKLGCEWLYRVVQEPRRMAGRYLSTNLAFAGLLAQELMAGRTARKINMRDGQ